MSFSQSSSSPESDKVVKLQKAPSSSSSVSTAALSIRAQRRGSRTTNACEACKKRKTKCSGPPGPCEACEKVDTFCHFNLRLDTRRKLAYKPTAVRERQQYILEGILQILKHSDSEDVQSLLKLIRSEARPQVIASSLRLNLQALQARGLIPPLEVDETDLVSLGLQGLFSHRAGRSSAKPTDDKVTDISVPACDAHHQDQQIMIRLSSSPNRGNPSIHPPHKFSNVNEEFHAFINDANMMNPLDFMNSADASENEFLHSANCRSHFEQSLAEPPGPPDTERLMRRLSSGNPQQVHATRLPIATETNVFKDFHRVEQDNWLTSGHAPPHIKSDSTLRTDVSPKEMFYFPVSAPATQQGKYRYDSREQREKRSARGADTEQINKYGRMGYEFPPRERMSHKGWNPPHSAYEVK